MPPANPEDDYLEPMSPNDPCAQEAVSPAPINTNTENFVTNVHYLTVLETRAEDELQ